MNKMISGTLSIYLRVASRNLVDQPANHRSKSNSVCNLCAIRVDSITLSMPQ
jgi:hypothetical protein